MIDTEMVWRSIRDRWWVVVGGCVLGILLAAIVYIATPSKYAAVVNAYVSTSSATPDASNAYQGGLLAEQRVKSYVQLFQTDDLATRAVARLPQPMSPSEFRKSVTAASQSETVLLTITAVDTNPERAMAIANAAGSALQEVVTELERPPRTYQRQPRLELWLPLRCRTITSPLIRFYI